MPKINYSKDAKIVSIKISNKKSVDSDVQGNVVLDYDKDGKLTNVDIMNISFNEFERAKTQLAQLTAVQVAAS